MKEISAPLSGRGPLNQLSISVPICLSAAYAHKAHTVRAAVLYGESKLASGSACICSKLSGSAENVNFSRLFPTDETAEFTIPIVSFFILSKILITVPPIK